MSRDEFEDLARREGYGTPKQVSFAPSSRSDMHTHDQMSFVYVCSGTFILNSADGAPRYEAGQTCNLPANTPHAEEAGPDGATILVARK